MVWTVNDPQCMVEAVRWDVDAILTDVTKTWLDLRSALSGQRSPFLRIFSILRRYSYLQLTTTRLPRNMAAYSSGRAFGTTRLCSPSSARR